MSPTDVTALAQPITAVIGVIAAALASLSTLRCSAAFKEFKEAEIKALKQQLELVGQDKQAIVGLLERRIKYLEEDSSVKVRENYICTKTSLEGIITQLQSDLEKKQQEQLSLDAQLRELKAQSAASPPASKQNVESQIEIVNAQRSLLGDTMGVMQASVNGLGDVANFLGAQIGGIGAGIGALMFGGGGIPQPPPVETGLLHVTPPAEAGNAQPTQSAAPVVPPTV